MRRMNAMQELKIPNSNITIHFEEQVELISTETIQQLESQSLLGRIWKIHDVAQRLNKGDNWIHKYILNNPRYLNDFNQIILLLGCLRQQHLHNG